MIDILVISHACFTAINRNVYHLFQKEGWKLQMVVPETLLFSSGIRKADLPQTMDPVIHYLKLKGTNPRLYTFEGLEAILGKTSPKIIILDNDPVSRLAWKLGKWCKKRNVLLYCISCENIPLDIRSGLSRRGLKALPAILLKRIFLHKTRTLVAGVFTINKAGEKIFQGEGYRNVRHMPLGFDPAFFFPDEIARNEIRRKFQLKEKVIAYFGRLTPEKGIHILIRALQNMSEPGWKLMMDEFDEYASDYNLQIKKQMLEADIVNRAVFVKPTHFEIPAYMNAADIIVVPSVQVPGWVEQYGRVAAEALACGKQVIASDSGALPELLNDHGYLFEEGNSGELTRLLRNLLSGSLAGQPSSEIALYAKEKLSIQKQQQVMLAAFQ